MEVAHLDEQAPSVWLGGHDVRHDLAIPRFETYVMKHYDTLAAGSPRHPPVIRQRDRREGDHPLPLYDPLGVDVQEAFTRCGAVRRAVCVVGEMVRLPPGFALLRDELPAAAHADASAFQPLGDLIYVADGTISGILADEDHPAVIRPKIPEACLSRTHRSTPKQDREAILVSPIQEDRLSFTLYSLLTQPLPASPRSNFWRRTRIPWQLTHLHRGTIRPSLAVSFFSVSGVE
ncbi:hypothetical protein D3C71_156560 [compost metagenome]